ncbi:arrestin [Pestalotiopsis sp. NC0098]|nr:arrestin [Pestalotiopsis sp. NC0098]
MGASDRITELSLDDGPSKKSFFDILSLPLRSRARNRNLAEFYVKPDDPHRQYSAGDHVTGSVFLTSTKPIRVTHLTVCLHGYVRVFKNAAQVNASNAAVVPSGGSNSFRYFGNGHAQLFQDEQVLCGEGRLEAQRYQFKFDLLFPSEGLPSSIDFERGTIAYVITATLTRPTSISPTTSAETRIALVEKVDVGLVPQPRERKVTMHALHKRQRRKKALATNTTPSRSATDLQEPASDLDSTRALEHSNENSVNHEDPSRNRPDDHYLPRSPIQSDIQSEISAGSVASHNSNSGRGADGSGGSNGSRVSAGIAEDREITATVELMKGGCMPGDLLPVRIRVDHNRRMKSLHGIVVTFYRQGRVDYAPPASLFTNLSREDARKLEREEFYPKSKTGLGGLSLSSAGSCSVFRKDLSQAVAPLIIDPTTLSANITTSVRVPEDVFPSIKGVPGGLIGFRYHVEVVVDLGGRLAGQSAGTPQQPSRLGSVSMAGNSAPGGASHDMQLSRLNSNWNGSLVDTDHLRREKGVISVSFEVVVGNLDTNRSRSKAAVRPMLTLHPPSDAGQPAEPNQTSYKWQDNHGESGDYHEHGASSMPYDPPQTWASSSAPAEVPGYSSYGHDASVPAYVPPPQMPDQDGLTEKERVRQAEQRLLPSQPSAPPDEPVAGPSQPSAPSDTTPRARPLAHVDSAVEVGEGPSAPALADLSTAAAHANPVDDKQELERRRLMAEASAPPEIPEDYEGSGPSAPPQDAAGPSTGHEPSAPVLSDQDLYGTHDSFENIAGPSTSRGPNEHEAEHLPKYER